MRVFLRGFRLIWAIALSVTLSSPSLAQHNNSTITWQIYDAPPNFILNGPHKGKGFIQQLLVLVTDNLPQYTHEFELGTQNRAIENLKEGQNVCHPALMVNPEREQYIHFTIPNLISPTSRLVTRDEPGMPEKVKLDDFLFNTNNLVALVKNRSFGSPIDELLNHRNAKRNIVRRANEHTDKIFQLIQAKRVDATIAYPAELNYFRLEQKASAVPLKIVGIEGATEFVVASMGCAKTKWGKSVVADLNQVLIKLRKSAEYREKMISWWKRQGASKSFNSFYMNEFISSH
jgi:uncharacterized protein (TIGR02285 family)